MSGFAPFFEPKSYLGASSTQNCWSARLVSPSHTCGRGHWLSKVAVLEFEVFVRGLTLLQYTSVTITPADFSLFETSLKLTENRTQRSA